MTDFDKLKLINHTFHKFFAYNFAYIWQLLILYVQEIVYVCNLGRDFFLDILANITIGR